MLATGFSSPPLWKHKIVLKWKVRAKTTIHSISYFFLKMLFISYALFTRMHSLYMLSVHTKYMLLQCSDRENCCSDLVFRCPCFLVTTSSAVRRFPLHGCCVSWTSMLFTGMNVNCLIDCMVSLVLSLYFTIFCVWIKCSSVMYLFTCSFLLRKMLFKHLCYTSS